jgi:hypothetical protein
MVAGMEDIFFIHKLSQDFAIRQAFNWLLYVAYSCFLVSLLFWRIFWIRTILAIGSTFFCVWCWTVPDISIQMDHFFFNLSYVIINVYQNMRLLNKYTPVKLSEEEKRLYERDFKEVFTETEFNIFLKTGRAEYLSSNESQLCKYGQSFRELIYVAKVTEGFSVCLEDKQGEVFTTVQEGSWIGLIEYAKREDYISEKKLNEAIHAGKYELIWNISCTIRDKNQKKLKLNNDITRMDTVVTADEYEHYQFLKRRDEGCIIYKFPIDVRLIYFLYFNYY